MTAGTFPTFAEFYAAVHGGRTPFPWQSRLAARAAATGWPAGVAVPTGLGKTSAIDVAVWALARQHDVPASQRTAPTRTWYVVDRRLPVDAAWGHGLRLQQLLADPVGAHGHRRDTEHAAALSAVADALRQIAGLGSTHGPLHVVRRRGGTAEGAPSPDPSQPALLFATVPMYASRWLFNGYGVSTRMRPVEAALAGTDSLVLLDESQSAAPLRRLLEPAAQCDVGNPAAVLPEPRHRPRFVELTATGGPSADVVCLDDDEHGNDYAHPTVVARLGAAKPTTVTETTSDNLPKSLAEEAAALLAAADEPVAVVVFANTPGTARRAFEEVRALTKKQKVGADAVLLTGRAREHDAAAVRDRILSPDGGVPAVTDPSPRARSLVVVATQTLESGSDVDFDALVTETAGTLALVQRFGRLNRLGVRPHARAVVVHPTDVKGGNWPVYGTEPAGVHERLAAAAQGGPVGMSPSRITDVLGEPADDPPVTPQLLPEHLWEWAKTAVPPPGAAPLEPFLKGIAGPSARVAVAWRATVPSFDDDGTEKARIHPPVHAAETVEVPIREVREAVAATCGGTAARVVDGAAVEHVAAQSLRPGDQVVFCVGAGLADEHGWNSEARAPVTDVSSVVSDVLLLTEDHLSNIYRDASAPVLAAVTAAARAVTEPGCGSPDLADVENLVRTLADNPPAALPGPAWADLIGRLAPRAHIGHGLPAHLTATRRPGGAGDVAADAFDELSFTAASACLSGHHERVGRLTENIVKAIGVPAAVAGAVALSAALHDIGKTDPRFQRWLSPDNTVDGVPLAKSGTHPSGRTAARIAAGWPAGGSHALLSGRLVTAWLGAHGPATDDDELLVHLVLSHHGEARPTVTVVHDPSPAPVTATIDGAAVTVTADLSVHDDDQPRRFRALCERYGYWGLALLETAVRLADHAASAQTGTPEVV